MKVLEQFNLNGKTALVTGGSRGLGLEIACGLREAGARVVLLARRESFFEEALRLIPDAVPIVGNVQDEGSLEAAFARTGPVDILVNAAGVTWGQDALEVPVEKIREVLDINITGALLASLLGLAILGSLTSLVDSPRLLLLILLLVGLAARQGARPRPGAFRRGMVLSPGPRGRNQGLKPRPEGSRTGQGSAPQAPGTHPCRGRASKSCSAWG